jgi:DNA repair protein RecO (recombination protein O)
MPSYTTRGIVIGRTNFGEADRIIRLITPDRGKLSAVAKGVRKIKSRSAGHLEPFADTSLMLATGKNLDVITSARLQWYPHELAANYDRLTFAFTIATALDRLTEPGHPQPGLYETTRDALRVANDSGPTPLLELWFKLRLAIALGYHPELGGCVICGRHDPDTTYQFDVRHGGIVCATDAPPDTPAITIPAIKLWRLIGSHTFQAVSALQNADTIATKTLPLVDQFYEYHLSYSFQQDIR